MVTEGWGVLGEAVGQDFEVGRILMTLRWTNPGREMTLTSWGVLGQSHTVITRDASTGTFRTGGLTAELRADGALTAKGRPVFSRDARGGLLMGNMAMKPVSPTSWAGKQRAKLIASGKLQYGGAAGPTTPVVAASAGTPRAATSDLNRAEWGLLAEVAGQAFESSGYLVTFQWLEPGISIEIAMTTRIGMGDARRVYARDAATGEIRQDKLRYLVAPDGTVQWTGGKNKLLWRDADGSLRIYNGLKLRPIASGSWQEVRLAGLVTGGKVAAAQAPIIDRAGSSASSVPRAATAVLGAASPAGRVTPEQRAMLGTYVGKSFADYQGTSPVGVVRTRWIVPDRRYEWRYERTFGAPSTFEYEVRDDGTIAISGTNASGDHAILGPDGLPIIFFAVNGKQWQTRLSSAPGGFTVVQLENTANVGKPPKWKVRLQVSRREVTSAEADRLVAAGLADRKARWSPVTPLLGNSWFCVMHEPVQWLTRKLPIHPQFGRPTNRSLPVMRLTSARWITPWQEMEIVSTLGTGRKVVDRITMLADGTFSMTTTGHDGVATLRGTYRKEQFSGILAFPVANFKVLGSTFSTGVSFSQNYGMAGEPVNVTSDFYGWSSGVTNCMFQKYDDAKSAAYEQELTASARSVQESMQADQEYWASAAQSHAEGQQMLANMRGELFRQVFVGIPQAVADVSQRRAQLDSLRIAAEQETAMRKAAADAARRTADRASANQPASPPQNRPDPVGSPGRPPVLASTARPIAPGRPPVAPTARRAPGEQTQRAGVYCYYNHGVAGQGATTIYISNLGILTGPPGPYPFDHVNTVVLGHWRSYLQSQQVAMVVEGASWVGRSACRVGGLQDMKTSRDSEISQSTIPVRQMPWAPQ